MNWLVRLSLILLALGIIGGAWVDLEQNERLTKLETPGADNAR